MTLISALISVKGTAVATDSLITVKATEDPTSVEQIEWETPKLVRLAKFSGTISFWGDFVAEVIITKFQGKITHKFGWTLYEWLRTKSTNITEETLEAFVQSLTAELQEEFFKLGRQNRGIGLHVTGYEYLDNTYIPELFLISNYADTSYTTLRELSYSRETFHTITNTPPAENHRDLECRRVVYSHLVNGGLIIYNNGDPSLFNPVLQATWNSFLDSRNRGRIKDTFELNELASLVRRPIEFVSKFQTDFFKKDKILIGGRIHDLAVWRDKNYISTSGD